MRRNLKNLRLRAIAAVDRPCQEHAKALVIKRAATDEERTVEIAKWLGDDSAAKTFREVLAETQFNQNVWPCVDALSQSIRSIVGDTSLTGGDRDAQISKSVQQFLKAVREISPGISKQLEPLLTKREGSTMDLETALALIETQKAEISTLTGKVAVAEKAKADAETDKAKADDECKKAKDALIAATDETLKVGDVEVKKSEVGEAQFNLTKGLQSEAQTARLEKRAAEEYPHVIGTATEKALVLKSIDSLEAENPTRKAVEAILTAAEKMTAAGFGNFGGHGGEEPTIKAARATYDEKVAEVMKRDSCSKSKAMSKVRAEYPAEFAAAHPNSSSAATARN